MKNLFKELRRREVFRSTGLYIGGAWIVLQVADIVLPVYDAPDWIFKALITIAIVGLPIAITLAWIFDFTAEGIQLDADDSGEKKALGRSKADYAVIGVLLAALSGSLFVNFAPREATVPVDIDPVSILIADFANQTGDSVFDGALEQVLTIGVEESSFITAFDRTNAGRVLNEIADPEAKLDAAGARLVSVREGVSVVVSGQLLLDGNKYEVSIDAIDPENGEVLANLKERAGGKSEVLAAVGELARDLREELGDVDVDSSAEGVETFTTVSVEAMHDYVLAQRLARDGKDDEALGLYQSAVEKDPKFGRAYSGLAVSAHKLGKTEIADAAWPKALELQDGMTERERYRTGGVYYSLVANNSKKAIENYEMLVEKYPADDAGHNNLAVAYFLALQFDKALETGRKVLDIYPTKPMYHANYALYAMYASDFETAATEAAKTLKLNPNYHKAYLPYAIAALIDGDLPAARSAYEKMQATGPRGASLANIGLADMLIWSGDAAGAEALLIEGMKADEAGANNRGLATKKMMNAYALWLQSRNVNEITDQIAESLAMSTGMAQLVPAALMYVNLGLTEQAEEIAIELGGRLEVQQRAYARLIDALILQTEGEAIAAIDELHEAIGLADVWLIRFYLGAAYVKAEHYAEANAEFTACRERLGEAYSLFLNDTPTFRYTADLEEWSVRARDNMTASFSLPATTETTNP